VNDPEPHVCRPLDRPAIVEVRSIWGVLTGTVLSIELPDHESHR
jgi:hypothetical protein